jgi:hypothetical protein
MSEAKNTGSRLEYVEVTIGKVKMRTTKAMAERFAKQIAKQPKYTQQFYNPVEFADTKAPEQVVGTDNL